MFISPHIKTIAKACSQVKPNLNTTVNVNNAFNPIPGACAKGTLANNPITKVPIAGSKNCSYKNCSLSIPVRANIDGFTNNIYAIVKKVVNPAANSSFHISPIFLKLKKLIHNCLLVLPDISNNIVSLYSYFCNSNFHILLVFHIITRYFPVKRIHSSPKTRTLHLLNLHFNSPYAIPYFISLLFLIYSTTILLLNN